MVNKIGDIAVLIAIAASFFVYHSVDFNIVFTLTPYVQNDYFSLFDYKVNVITVIAFFLFLGSIGKSAQLGLHT